SGKRQSADYSFQHDALQILYMLGLRDVGKDDDEIPDMAAAVANGTDACRNPDLAARFAVEQRIGMKNLVVPGCLPQPFNRRRIGIGSSKKLRRPLASHLFQRV